MATLNDLVAAEADCKRLEAALLRAMCLPSCGHHGTEMQGRDCEHCVKRMSAALDHQQSTTEPK